MLPPEHDRILNHTSTSYTSTIPSTLAQLRPVIASPFLSLIGTHNELGEHIDSPTFTAKVVAGNETVLETSTGLRLPNNPALISNETILKVSSRTDSGSQNVTVQQTPATTNALFPPLPVFGPPTFPRRAQLEVYKIVSFVLSFTFLMIIVAGTLVDGIGVALQLICHRGQNLAQRPFRRKSLKRSKDEMKKIK